MGNATVVPEQQGAPGEDGAHCREIQLAGVHVALVVPRSPGAPAIASSAAAKEIVHFVFPQHSEGSEILVKNTSKPLDVAAKESDKKIRVKTIRHTDCIEVGHDRYDEMVTDFLQKVGKENIISINSINYTHIDMASKQLMTEYGVSIVYNG